MTKAEAARFNRVLDHLMYMAGDRDQVERDLLELTYSARQAMKDGPTFAEVREHLPSMYWEPRGPK